MMIKKHVLVSLFILSTYACIQPMAHQLPYSAAASSHLTTGVHWAIAAGYPLFKNLANLYHNMTVVNFKDADQEVTHFIKSTIKDACGHDIIGVKINHASLLPMVETVFTHYIVINEPSAQEIKDALATNNRAILDSWVAVLQHEASHIKHNDDARYMAACFAIPFITHAVTTFAYHAFMPAKIKAAYAQQPQLLNTISAASWQLLINMAVMAKISQYIEQRADDEIADNLDNLHGIKHFFEQIDTLMHNHPALLRLKERLPAPMVNFLLAVDRFFSSHPSMAARVEKLNARIALLEQQPL